jgi:hypothetical protein
VFEKYKIGSFIVFPAFTSTSTDKTLAFQFGFGHDNKNECCIIFKIKYQFKDNMIKQYRSKNITEDNKCEEEETLFPPFSKFTVTEIEEKLYPKEPYKDKTYYEISLKSCIGINYFFTITHFLNSSYI